MEKTFGEDLLNIFAQPARIIIAGYTNSGKTYLCTRLVEKYHHIFTRIIICGVTSHPLQQKHFLTEKIELHQDIIDPVNEANPFINPNKHILFILDDNFLTSANSQTVVDCFTKGRHRKISVIMITQNLFFPGKYARTIALNASHYILMRSRDLYQVQCLGRQFFGSVGAKQFLDIYKNTVIGKTYGYLLCDLTVKTPEALQLRTNIVNEPPCEKVFLL